MRNARILRWNRFSPSAIVRLLLVSTFSVFPVFSQTQVRMIAWQKDNAYTHKSRSGTDNNIKARIDEIELIGVVVEGRSVNIGEAFPASDDWLKNIGFHVKNISGKQLKNIQITLVLPDITSGSPEIPFLAHLDKEKGLTPGEEVELTLPEGGLYAWVKDRIAEKGSLSRISKADILAVFVTLPDGTVWASGCLKTPGSKNACPSPAH
jgi:hypothetical protein